MPAATSFTEAFVVLVLVACAVAYMKRVYGEVTVVRSALDGRAYIVRALPDRQEAADRLARLNADLSKLAAHMAAKFPRDDGARQLLANYNPDALSEGGVEAGFTSYSVNKGERIVMCLRQAHTNAFVDENTIRYVAVHELGHLMTDEVGHTPKFWANFKRILQEAVALRIYRDVDYAKSPAPYCGITIESSVLR
jgi:hypothetical protein